MGGVGQAGGRRRAGGWFGRLRWPSHGDDGSSPDAPSKGRPAAGSEETFSLHMGVGNPRRIPLSRHPSVTCLHKLNVFSISELGRKLFDKIFGCRPRSMWCHRINSQAQMDSYTTNTDEATRIDSGLKNKFRFEWLTCKDEHGNMLSSYMRKPRQRGLGSENFHLNLFSWF